MIKVIRRTAISIMAIVAVLLALPLMVYVPPVQRWLVGKATELGSDATGMDITIGAVSLRPPLTLSLEDVVVVSHGNDTIASIGRADASLAMLPLLSLRAELGSFAVSNARLNTLDLISDTQVSGAIGSLSVNGAVADLSNSTADVASILLADADICVLLSDTAAIDTTTTAPLPWFITLGEAAISNTRCELHLPGDSTIVAATLGNVVVSTAGIDLLHSRYAVASIAIDGSSLSYDNPFEPRLSQPSLLDYSHLALDDVSLAIDSVCYDVSVPSFLTLAVRHAAMQEQCGLKIDDFRAAVALDSLGFRLPSLSLRTPASSVYAEASLDYAALDSAACTVDCANSAALTLDASLSPADLVHFHPLKSLPDWPLTITAKANGNMAAATVETFTLDYPSVLHAEARGTVILDAHASIAGRQPVPDASTLSGHLTLHNSSPLLSAIDVPHSDWRIPHGLRLDYSLRSDGRQYIANLAARGGLSAVKAKALVDTYTEAYSADLDIATLSVGSFVPAVPAVINNATLTARGRGFDPYSSKSFMDATARIDSAAFMEWTSDSVQLTAALDKGSAVAQLDFSRLNATALPAGKNSLDIGMTGYVKAETDLRNTHKLSSFIHDIVITDSTGTYFPENLGLLLSARPDTTYARVQNGNFIVKLDASGPYDRLLDRLTALADTVTHQMENRIIDQGRIKQMLPTMRLYVTCGRDNVPANFLRASNGIDFSDLLIDVAMSSAGGINGQMHLYNLASGENTIDTTLVTLLDSDHGLTYRARVAQRKKNPLRFTALLDGHLYEHGALVGLRIFDKEGGLGLRIGTKATMEDNGLRFTLMPKNPTIAFREFSINDDNFLFLRNDLRLSAKLYMEDSEGTTIDVYSVGADSSDPSAALYADSTRLQDLTVSAARLNLQQLTASAPFLPKIAGFLNGDFHFIMDSKKQISVASDISVDNLAYENNAIGNLNTEFVYLQNNDNTHSVDGILLIDDRQVASVEGKYINKKVSDGNEYLDGTLTLKDTPLNMANGFITDQIAGLEGFANGQLSMKGPLDRLIMDGEMRLSSAMLFSTPYGIRMAIDDRPITITRSKLTLDAFKLYASDQPVSSSDAAARTASGDTIAYVTASGSADFSGDGPTTLDFRIRANELQLINSRQQAGSLLFGKGFINLMAMLRGTTDKMTVRGRLGVLGKTDVTYLLLDSPLSTDNQMDELVRFVDFSDSTEVAKLTKPNAEPHSHIDVNLTVSIDPGAHVRCGLNADQSNYVDFFGGGDLRLRMSGTDDMLLTGRYTLSNGTMKYSLPVIPLKTFTIQDGSYVEFTGKMDDPTLNITATERTRATVGQDGSTSRVVTFDCGVVVTKKLSDMGLQFIIEAPEDMSVQSELQSMTTEQRGKLAVTMLTTGMYLSDGNTAGFSMNSALSSFLQSEINNIAGSALSTLDVDMGIDNTTDASGNTHTDYSFQFAKRFWNNRLRVQIGGKVSSGQDAQSGQKQSFFDNVSMEYRLSPVSNQYLKLFYKQNVYDWLDGYTSEYGAGYIYKRKMDHWWDIFQLWKTEEKNKSLYRR